VCANSPTHPGKTTFLKFTLARLISHRQVVLLCDITKAFLFYHGKVYSRPTQYGFGDLPIHQEATYCPIWALLDVDYQDQGPPITARANIWPIQASYPNPIQWKSWRKQYNAALLGMPLWKMDDLMEGYVFSVFSPSAINSSHATR